MHCTVGRLKPKIQKSVGNFEKPYCLPQMLKSKFLDIFRMEWHRMGLQSAKKNFDFSFCGTLFIAQFFSF